MMTQLVPDRAWDGTHSLPSESKHLIPTLFLNSLFMVWKVPSFTMTYIHAT